MPEANADLVAGFEGGLAGPGVPGHFLKCCHGGLDDERGQVGAGEPVAALEKAKDIYREPHLAGISP